MRVKCLTVVSSFIVTAIPVIPDHLKMDLSVSGQQGGVTGYNWDNFVQFSTNWLTCTRYSASEWWY